MSNPPPPTLPSNAYRSYLVRSWQSTEQGCWRASAQCVQTGHTRLFGDLERLLAFLHSEIKPKENQDEQPLDRQ
jgi:hypothetical protein